jgi:hypothetical protein
MVIVAARVAVAPEAAGLDAPLDADACVAAACGAAVCVEEDAGVCAIAHPVIRRAPATRVHIHVTSFGMYPRSSL